MPSVIIKGNRRDTLSEINSNSFGSAFGNDPRDILDANASLSTLLDFLDQTQGVLEEITIGVKESRDGLVTDTLVYSVLSENRSYANLLNELDFIEQTVNRYNKTKNTFFAKYIVYQLDAETQGTGRWALIESLEYEELPDAGFSSLTKFTIRIKRKPWFWMGNPNPNGGDWVTLINGATVNNRPSTYDAYQVPRNSMIFGGSRSTLPIETCIEIAGYTSYSYILGFGLNMNHASSATTPIYFYTDPPLRDDDQTTIYAGARATGVFLDNLIQPYNDASAEKSSGSMTLGEYLYYIGKIDIYQGVQVAGSSVLPNVHPAQFRTVKNTIAIESNTFQLPLFEKLITTNDNFVFEYMGSADTSKGFFEDPSTWSGMPGQVNGVYLTSQLFQYGINTDEYPGLPLNGVKATRPIAVPSDYGSLRIVPDVTFGLNDQGVTSTGFQNTVVINSAFNTINVALLDGFDFNALNFLPYQQRGDFIRIPPDVTGFFTPTVYMTGRQTFPFGAPGQLQFTETSVAFDSSNPIHIPLLFDGPDEFADDANPTLPVPTMTVKGLGRVRTLYET